MVRSAAGALKFATRMPEREREKKGNRKGARAYRLCRLFFLFPPRTRVRMWLIARCVALKSPHSYLSNFPIPYVRALKRNKSRARDAYASGLFNWPDVLFICPLDFAAAALMNTSDVSWRAQGRLFFSSVGRKWREERRGKKHVRHLRGIGSVAIFFSLFFSRGEIDFVFRVGAASYARFYEWRRRRGVKTYRSGARGAFYFRPALNFERDILIIRTFLCANALTKAEGQVFGRARWIFRL